MEELKKLYPNIIKDNTIKFELIYLFNSSIKGYNKLVEELKTRPLKVKNLLHENIENIRTFL